MIKIEAIVRPEKLEDVKDALSMINVHGITLYQVMGCGAQKGGTKNVRGHAVQVNLIPKIKFGIAESFPPRAGRIFWVASGWNMRYTETGNCSHLTSERKRRYIIWKLEFAASRRLRLQRQ